MLNRLLRPNVRALTPYDAETTMGGIRLDANENPFPWPAGVAEKIAGGVEFNRYPDGKAAALREALAARLGLSGAEVLVGNGSDELIQMVLQAFGGPAQALLIPTPTFSMYGVAASVTDTPLLEVPLAAGGQALDLDNMLRLCRENPVSVIIACNPNNPTGALFPPEDITRLLRESEALVMVDEAYGEFAGAGASMLPYIREYHNLLILKTFSKAFGMAALRLGYLCARAEAVALLDRVRPTFNVNAFSQKAGLAALEFSAVYEEQIAVLTAETEKLYLGLKALPGVKVWPTRANFVLFQPREAARWGEALRERGFAVRVFGNLPVLGPCLRVSAGTPAENEAFLRAAAEIQASAPAHEF
ncbi:MAG: histidinol-phosphate transaminase [Gracilibacteraceae bacterium]|jgi:histidinol-phosphate aminotransferase|nr:histidinol-phosphate transaminase [Gracilibacteraceae bacterium]